MRITLQYRTYLLASMVAGSVLFGSCKKDKVPIAEPTDLTKWEKINGNYKVFDTLGNYLYDMSITHIKGVQNNSDSLYFENLDNKFSFTTWQSPWGSMPETYIVIGDYNPITDKNNKRWHLFQETDENFNVLINDTIHLKFWKSNIQYYLEDTTPYFEGFSKQIAVKQH